MYGHSNMIVCIKECYIAYVTDAYAFNINTMTILEYRIKNSRTL